MRSQRAHLFSSGTSNVGSRRMRLYGRGVPRDHPGGCRDGAPAPSASTNGNIDGNPDSGQSPRSPGCGRHRGAVPTSSASTNGNFVSARLTFPPSGGTEGGSNAASLPQSCNLSASHLSISVIFDIFIAFSLKKLAYIKYVVYICD